MNDERLEALLKEQLQNEEIKADAQLVYATRQKAWLTEEERNKKESMKALIYASILHVLWLVVLMGISLITQGINAMLAIGLRSLILSGVLIIIGCMRVLYIQEIVKGRVR